MRKVKVELRSYDEDYSGIDHARREDFYRKRESLATPGEEEVRSCIRDLMFILDGIKTVILDKEDYDPEEYTEHLESFFEDLNLNHSSLHRELEGLIHVYDNGDPYDVL